MFAAPRYFHEQYVITERQVIFMNNITNVLLIINFEKRIPQTFISELSGELNRHGCLISVFENDLRKIEKMNIPVTFRSISCGNLPDDIEIAIVLGGDGSIIGAASDICEFDIPILGINFGHVGYLAELEETDISLIASVLKHDFIIDERMMLEAEIIRRDGSIIASPPALNDIVLSNGPVARLLNFDLHCDGILVQKCRSDGLIVATPTGSTAYSMSAGGPILAPQLDAFCLTPICPHSLNNRPVIVPGESKIEISVAENVTDNIDNSVFVSIDGHTAIKIGFGDRIKIERSSFRTKLIRLKNNSFLSVLNSKL